MSTAAPESRDYFVVFEYWTKYGGQGTAFTSVTRTKPVADFEDARGMADHIKTVHDYKNVVVVNWRLFEGQPEWA